MPELLLLRPEGQARPVPLAEEGLHLGRSSTNELSFPDDPSLSRRHLIFAREGDDWTVSDLGSRNGTFVNGVRITTKHYLQPDDRISAGHVEILYDSPKLSEPQVTFEKSPAGTLPANMVTTSLTRLIGWQKMELHPRPGTGGAPWLTPLQALFRTGRELALRRPLPELFRVILDLALESVGAERGVLLTDEGGQLVVRASRGEDFRISTAVRDRVLQGRESLLVEDVHEDAILHTRESLVLPGVRSLMAVPLETDDRVIGLIYLDSSLPSRPFTSDDLNLLTVMANVAAMRIEHARLALVEEAERQFERELAHAAEIQGMHLPSCAPVVPGFDIAGHNTPCRTVGGDYYDFLPFPDGRLGILVADVAGKGMPAALLMMSLQARVHALAAYSDDVAGMASRLNGSLLASIPKNCFVTMFFGVLDPRAGEMTYCNSGHNPPLLLRASGGFEELEAGGPVLGLLPSVSYQQQRCRVDPGDLLALFSDGVVEAENPSGEELGKHRLGMLLAEQRDQPSEAVIEAVLRTACEWRAGAPAADDITLVLVRRTQSAAP